MLSNCCIPLLREAIRRSPVLDDSILYQWSECQSAHWTIIYQGIPLVLVNAVLALFAIFLTSRLGTRLIPSRDVIATFAPRVADEAAHAYESGGRQELEQFERSLVGKTGLELYLIDGYGKDVLSQPIPTDSLSIVRAARSDGGILNREAGCRFSARS